MSASVSLMKIMKNTLWFANCNLTDSNFPLEEHLRKKVLKQCIKVIIMLIVILILFLVSSFIRYKIRLSNEKDLQTPLC